MDLNSLVLGIRGYATGQYATPEGATASKQQVAAVIAQGFRNRERSGHLDASRLPVRRTFA